MQNSPLRSLRTLLPIAATAAAMLLAGCAEPTPLSPSGQPTLVPQYRGASGTAGPEQALATMRSATARYHDIRVAEHEGFLLLHECENRPGEGPVGIVYYHPGHLLDGVIDPASPDALIYEPSRRGRPKLVGAEFAVLDVGQAAPTFLGHEFQREDEFGVFGLHAWIWRHNPEGMFAESNPKVSCEAE